MKLIKVVLTGTAILSYSYCGDNQTFMPSGGAEVIDTKIEPNNVITDEELERVRKLEKVIQDYLNKQKEEKFLSQVDRKPASAGVVVDIEDIDVSDVLNPNSIKEIDKSDINNSEIIKPKDKK